LHASAHAAAHNCACAWFVSRRAAGTCFAGDSLVRVRDGASERLVAMRDLRTGQHVRCLHSGDDLAAPRELAWCEVTAWVRRAVLCAFAVVCVPSACASALSTWTHTQHCPPCRTHPAHTQARADDTETTHRHITFSRPDGTRGSIRVTPQHSVYRLAAAAQAQATPVAATVDARERPGTARAQCRV
jgi:hypothetical protein